MNSLRTVLKSIRTNVFILLCHPPTLASIHCADKYVRLVLVLSFRLEGEVANQAWTACNVSLSSFPSSPLIRYNSRGHSNSHRGAVSAVLALYYVSTWVGLAESTANPPKTCNFLCCWEEQWFQMCTCKSRRGCPLHPSWPVGSPSQKWAPSLCKWTSSSLGRGDHSLSRALSSWMLSKSGVNKLRMLKKIGPENANY